MAKGISIHVGINEVTSNVFTAPKLNHCEDDANAMLTLATDAGFTPAISPATGHREPLLGENATFANVVKAIQDAACELKAGETFLFTFSGHGSQQVTLDLINEPDGRDETIVLSDHLLFDSFWRSDLWPGFQPGVRAITVADCCHGGGVFRLLDLFTAILSRDETAKANFVTQLETASAVLVRASQTLRSRTSQRGSRLFFQQASTSFRVSNLVVRTISDAERQKELDANRDFYARQFAPATLPITVSRLFLAACQEGEDAVEGAHHGAFTQVLLDVWNGGAFVGNYPEFMTKIRSKFVGTIQHPDIEPIPLPAFSSERPFTI